MSLKVWVSFSSAENAENGMKYGTISISRPKLQGPRLHARCYPPCHTKYSSRAMRVLVLGREVTACYCVK